MVAEPEDVRASPDGSLHNRHLGGVAERTNAAVLKTADPQGFVGSNPTPSASFGSNAGSNRRTLPDR